MSIVSALLELLTRFRVTRKCPLLFVIREPDSLSRRARSERSYEASYRFFVSMTKGLPFGYEIDQHVCLPVLESPPARPEKAPRVVLRVQIPGGWRGEDMYSYDTD